MLTLNMFLKPEKLLFMSRGLFHFCKVIKSSQPNASKLYRIASNSGCLLTGCCFSRKSDEDSLISKAKKYRRVDTDIKSEDRVHATVTTEDGRDTNNMKRSSEFIQNIVSEDSNAHKIAVQTSDANNKRRKISDEETENITGIEIKLSNTECDSLPCTVAEPLLPPLENEIKELLPGKIRPNYFVAVKVSNQEIHENLKDIQNHILKNQSNLRKSMTDLKTLHITLMVMHISNTETYARAMEALKSVHQEHDKEMSDNPLQLEFRGLGHFQNRVLFAKLSTDDSYKRLCNLAESVKKHFAENLIFSTDKRSQFTPHLTVAKIDFKKKQNRFVKKIDPELYEDYIDQYFGSQKIESIQLLRMIGPKNEEGYYCGDEIYFSAFDPSINMNDLCESLEVDKKKKYIREVISSLMKEKLK